MHIEKKKVTLKSSALEVFIFSKSHALSYITRGQWPQGLAVVSGSGQLRSGPQNTDALSVSMRKLRSFPGSYSTAGFPLEESQRNHGCDKLKKSSVSFAVYRGICESVDMIHIHMIWGRRSVCCV